MSSRVCRDGSASGKRLHQARSARRTWCSGLRCRRSKPRSVRTEIRASVGAPGVPIFGKNPPNAGRLFATAGAKVSGRAKRGLAGSRNGVAAGGPCRRTVVRSAVRVRGPPGAVYATPPRRAVAPERSVGVGGSRGRVSVAKRRARHLSPPRWAKARGFTRGQMRHEPSRIYEIPNVTRQRKGKGVLPSKKRGCVS